MDDCQGTHHEASTPASRRRTSREQPRASASASAELKHVDKCQYVWRRRRCTSRTPFTHVRSPRKPNHCLSLASV
jgi:hypothetical protein